MPSYNGLKVGVIGCGRLGKQLVKVLLDLGWFYLNALLDCNVKCIYSITCTYINLSNKPTSL